MNTKAIELFNYLESIAPLHLQESYDNSGLLVGDANQEIKGVLIALDCTEAILEEAKQLNCNVIITHHPAIFYGVKRLTGSNLTERLIIQAIKNDIILYAIHTNLDNIFEGGVNERIAQQLGLNITGVLRTVEDANSGSRGVGVTGNFDQAMNEIAFLELLKNQMGARVIRHSKLLGRPVEKVAICGGSGSFLLEEACRSGAQAFITADYKYHGFFDADGRIMICDIGHYESEQFTSSMLQEVISRKFSTFAAHYTSLNTNPVHYFT